MKKKNLTKNLKFSAITKTKMEKYYVIIKTVHHTSGNLSWIWDKGLNEMRGIEN